MLKAGMVEDLIQILGDLLSDLMVYAPYLMVPTIRLKFVHLL